MEEKRMKLFTVFVSISVIITAFSVFMGDVVTKAEIDSPQDGNDDWPMFHHDPQHTGHSSSTVPLTNNTRWNKQIAKNGYKISPVVSSGMIYVSSNEKLYALNADTGDEIWAFEVENSSYPAVEDNIVIFGSTNGKIYALNAENGDKVWEFAIGKPNSIQAPTIVNGRVFLSGYCAALRLPGFIIKNKVFVLRLSDGHEIWNYTTEDDVSCSPTVDNGKVFFGSYGKTYALNESTGEELWNFPVETFSSPVAKDGVIFIGGLSKIYALNSTTGAEIWNTTIGWRTEDLVICDNILVANSLGTISGINATTGEKIWTFGTGYIGSYLAATDDVVVIGSAKIYAVDAQSGMLIWSYNVPVEGYATDYIWFSPAISNNMVFVSCGNGKLYVFGPSIENFGFVIVTAIGVVGIIVILYIIRKRFTGKGKL
jgi:outer membrane protein assembly factor BamB